MVSKQNTEAGLYSMCCRHVFPGDHIGDGLVNMSSVGALPTIELVVPRPASLYVQAWVQEM